jgi:hypothetical protein
VLDARTDEDALCYTAQAEVSDTTKWNFNRDWETQANDCSCMFVQVKVSCPCMGEWMDQHFLDLGTNWR